MRRLFVAGPIVAIILDLVNLDISFNPVLDEVNLNSDLKYLKSVSVQEDSMNQIAGFDRSNLFKITRSSSKNLQPNILALGKVISTLVWKTL
jgi:hypothetical protein